MLWIKEVDIVDTFDDPMSSRPVQGHHLPNFEMLDAKIASALNKIIQNSYLRKRVSLEEQRAQVQDRFLRGRKNVFMIYEDFRVTGAHDAFLAYANLFNLGLRNDNVQAFDTNWTKFYYQ